MSECDWNRDRILRYWLQRVRELEAVIKDCIDTECRKCYNYKTCDDKTNYGCGIYKLKKILNNEET
jgi:hypothetical protein